MKRKLLLGCFIGDYRITIEEIRPDRYSVNYEKSGSYQSRNGLTLEEATAYYRDCQFEAREILKFAKKWGYR